MLRTGEHLLNKCIMSEYQYRLLVEEYLIEREKIIAGHYPGYDTDCGMIQQETTSTENTAIYLIEAETALKNAAKKLHSDRQMLRWALDRLNQREKDVFNHLIWNEPLKRKLDDVLLNEVSARVQQKLVKYLSGVIHV